MRHALWWDRDSEECAACVSNAPNVSVEAGEVHANDDEGRAHANDFDCNECARRANGVPGGHEHTSAVCPRFALKIGLFAVVLLAMGREVSGVLAEKSGIDLS
jgi:hypothetical protein